MSEYEIPVTGAINDYTVPLHGHLDVVVREYPVIPNPEGEPTADITKMGIDETIYAVRDAGVHEWARAAEKPTYTKAEIGLGNVDNTSDLNKPISNATQAALDEKVDKIAGKGLSTNDYTDEAKAIVDGVTSALASKVDKEEGKGLSENDFTDTLKSKLDGIEAEANKTVVDNALDGTSANPVENRVVKSSLDEKLNADETAVNSNGLVIATPVTDTAPYIYRQTPVKESFKALMHKIVGASVVWNQLGFQTGYSATTQYSPMFRSSTESLKADTLSGHKYLISFIQPSGCAVYRQNRTGLTVGYQGYSAPTSNTRISFLVSCTESQTQLDLAPLISKNATTEESYYLTNAIFTDLTAMFGTTIADYVYTLETSQSGSGIAWLQSYGFFTKDYYAYKQNKLESGCVSAHKTYDGETLLINTELSPITLRGLFKLSTDKLTVDGDEYNADGSVTRKFEQRAYQSGDESLANAITDGTNTIVKLATPTTEQTTPFTETEIVGSTEEFIDYEVAQGNRDVAIPVGTETEYYQEMKLPSLPTTSGNHNLIYNIATGFGWS